MLKPLSDGVWYASGPVSFLGLRLTVTMTVLRLEDGTLLLHSPLPLTAALNTEVTSLGPVSHLYAPNAFHYMWLGQWISTYPGARVHAPQALAAKCPDLRIDRFHDRDESRELPGVDEIPIRGFRMRETVLVHKRSGTVVVADLVHNVGTPEHWWTRLYSKTMGFYDRVALSRVLRWTSFDDRKSARLSVDAVLAQPFEHLIVGHGAPIMHNARDVLVTATSWLPIAARPKLTSGESSDARLSLKPCG